MKKIITSILLSSLLMISSCGGGTSTFDQFLGPQSGDTVATIKTAMGDIKIRLFANLTPEMAKNFTTLAESGYYDGLVFHRVIDGFMIQGGDPNGNGTGGSSYKGEGTTLNDEIIDGLTHVRGAISMANRGANTNGSQFFIVQTDSTYLDGGYSLFGQVYEGMDVVDAIAKVEINSMDKPSTDVVIETVSISTY